MSGILLIEIKAITINPANTTGKYKYLEIESFFLYGNIGEEKIVFSIDKTGTKTREITNPDIKPTNQFTDFY